MEDAMKKGNVHEHFCKKLHRRLGLSMAELVIVCENIAYDMKTGGRNVQ